MNKSLRTYGFWGFIFTGILGVILHFLYDFTGRSVLVAPFSAINESTWEHMKLLFFPMLIFAFVEYFAVGKDYPSYWCAKAWGILTGLILIPVLFYTLNGIFGTTPDWVNIAIFFVSAGVGYIAETYLLNRNKPKCQSPGTALLALIIIAVLFAVWTFVPPSIPIFADPLIR